MKDEFASGKEILEYIQDMHQSGWEGVPYEDEEAILKHPDWTLVTAELKDLKAGNHHPPVAKEYAKIEGELPSIVVNADGFILDGVHRYYAAKLRGEKTILAYVPSTSVR